MNRSKQDLLDFLINSNIDREDAPKLYAMNDTFEVRRQYIKRENPSLQQVLMKYSKLKDFKGDLINSEFRKMFPDSENFLRVFPSYYALRIVKYDSNCRPELTRRFSEEVDENLSALLMLAELFLVIVPRKKKVSGDSVQSGEKSS